MSEASSKGLAIDRRRVLLVAGGLAAGIALVSRAAWASPQEAQDLLKKLAKGDAKDGRIVLEAPEIAENGNTVPIKISVESPMTAANHVKAVHVVADRNPRPGVASFFFAPEAGKAEVEVRIRMGETQNLIAVAEMSDGSVWRAVREVKVTIGGCGG